METKNYYISKGRKKKEVVCFEYDKITGYEIIPKVTEKGSIEVSKIIFVNNDFSEKIIRKKINNKIAKLLEELHQIEEDDGTDNGSIKRSIMDAEKLRIQIINNYTKYLGHTYESLTLEKIKIIVNELRFNLFKNMNNIIENEYYEEKNSRRGR